MFDELANFALTRKNKEAFGFYCAYFLLIIIGAMAFSGAVGGIFFQDMNPEHGFELGQRIGAVVALLACVFLAYRILESKHLMSNFSSYVFLAATAVLTMLGGALLGMIPVAYLTTRTYSRGGSAPQAGAVPTQDSSETKVKT